MSNRRKLISGALASLRRLPQPPNPTSHPPRVSARSFLFSRHPSTPLHRCRDLVSGSPAYSTEPGRGGGGGACWNCGAAGSFLSCSSCGTVQPMDPAVDYFQIFGFDKRYDIPDENLGGKYKDWQKKLHPDLVQRKSEKEKAFAADQSGRVIDAYRTLSKPLSRAIYLMLLEGIQVDEEKTVTDPELLMEMMDIRESVDEADDSQKLKQIRHQIQKKFEVSSTSFQDAFQKQDFDNAISSIQRMRYYERAIEAIEKKLPAS